MLAALIRLFPKHNLWIWRWARALNFFGQFLLLIEFQRLKFNFLNRNALKRMQTLSFCDHVAQQRHVSV